MIFIGFLPILLFIGIYVGAGIYFSLIGTENAFYQLSPTVAIIPALALGWILHRGKSEERMQSFLMGCDIPILSLCALYFYSLAHSVL